MTDKYTRSSIDSHTWLCGLLYYFFTWGKKMACGTVLLYYSSILQVATTTLGSVAVCGCYVLAGNLMLAFNSTFENEVVVCIV